MLAFPFDAEKAVEVLLYIAGRCPDIYNVLKILYYADRTHLQRYGRTICGGSYDAMKFGAVPREAYTLIRHVRGDNAYCSHVDASEAFQADLRRIYPQRAANLDYLSESDIEVLDPIIEQYKDLTFDQMHAIAEKEPEYIEADREQITIREIIRHLPNAEVVFEYLEAA